MFPRPTGAYAEITGGFALSEWRLEAEVPDN